jgi:hypothetical protein
LSGHVVGNNININEFEALYLEAKVLNDKN